jgi:O-antigen ligase
MRELAITIVIGALLYVPLCLFEMRAGPVLHKHVYGFIQQTFRESKRWGGYRPTVFLQHGLAVGMFMCTAALVGVWTWRSRVARSIAGIPTGLAVMAVLVTAIFCKSTGAILLLCGGLGVMYASVKLRSRGLLIGMVLIAPLYMGVRTLGLWSGQQLVSVTDDAIGADRAESMAMRLRNEDRLVGKALERPVFGWGRFGRNHIIDAETGKHTVSDGMWVIAIGQAGLVGLVSLTLMLLLPVWLLIHGCNARFWSQPAIAPAAALAVLLVLHMIDNLFNAMPNPLFLLAAGGLPQVAAIAAAACATAEAKAAPLAREMIARPILRRV